MLENKNKMMINLSIYFFIFTVVVWIVITIMGYFYGNLKKIDSEISISSDYSLLNLYFLKTIKKDNVTIKNYGIIGEDTNSYFITFSMEDGTTNTFSKVGDIIYFNKIKLCESVKIFKVIVDRSEKESILVETQIKDEKNTSQYVL